ncbi:MAG: hypothetical protein CVU22_17035 [Betaproteobacteria bacterium HGW-Betaproteobacteria-16]|nr:MAG: hypothetical protein CVU22_17035 [Betaproteobacteria bacterium HGW-Betaproteobacteria-16]
MQNRTPISIADLEVALEWSSSGQPYESQAFIDRTTGELHLQSMHGELGELLPPDLEDSSQYIAMPHKNDLDLGRQLVFDFADSESPHMADEVRRIFREKGAYGRFKVLLERTGELQKWYEFENAATQKALLQWAEDNGFQVEGGNAN